MNKKNVKRFIGLAIVVIIVILNVRKTPSILFPVLGLGGIILFGMVLCALLNFKDRLDRKGAIDYGKIPTVGIVIASVVVAIIVGYIVYAPLAKFAGVVAIILAILFCYKDHRAKKESRIINFKTRKIFHKSKFKNNSFVRTMDSFLEKFFPDAKTRNIAKVVICIMLVAVVLSFVIPNFSEIVIGVAVLILAIYAISSMEKHEK